ncbi:MAG: hypothetical protein SGI92_32710 [Bryobacteraceae bacterium]|nr:hypothetical protein [Bryobacteraceae bacterium]
MKKKSVVADRDSDMREEYDLSQLKGGVRGKYPDQATAGTNLVLIEPDLMDIFPDSQSRETEPNRPGGSDPHRRFDFRPTIRQTDSFRMADGQKSSGSPSWTRFELSWFARHR